MSRVPKWKFNKTKVKVVFRLQFHATNIPQSGWDKLFVSFIPADIGKATAKTNKANVRNGNCKWADPIYETTRLLHDTSTKKYDEKLYRLVVAMGTSRASLLGEIYINLADYADASKPISVALPLEGCEFGTILHVTVQLLTSKTGFREFEQQREIREKGFNQISNQNQESVRKIRDSAEGVMNQIDKVNARVRFKPESMELHSLEDAGGLNEDFDDSAIGLDGSSCTSDSVCAERIEISGIHESGTMKTTVSSEVGGIHPVQNTQPDNKEKAEYHLLAQGSSEWAHGWSSDYSVDNDLSSISVYDENNRMKGCLETTESSLLEMKMEIDSLQCLADELGTETQRLTHQFSSELASGEMLAKEVSTLKSECLNLKGELETLRNHKRMTQLASVMPMEGNDVKVIQATGMKQLVPIQFLPDKEQDEKNMMKEKICKLLTELEESKAKQEALTKKMNQMGCYYETLIHELEERNKNTQNELENIKAEHRSCYSTISAFHGQAEKMHQEMNEQLMKLAEDKWYLESLNKELEKRAVASETALKRVRWTYSMAVDRLQKDLELLSVQVLSMFETNENLAKQAFAEASRLFLDGHPEQQPELIQSTMKNDSRPPSQQIVHNSSDVHHQLPIHENRASPILSGIPLEYKLGQSFDIKSDNKGTFFPRVPIYEELQGNMDVGPPHVNGSKAGKTCSVLLSHSLIHGKRNLIPFNEEFAGMLKSDDFARYSPIHYPKMDSGESKGVVLYSENPRTKPEAKVSPCLQEKHSLEMEVELFEVHMLNVHLEVFSKVLQETLHEKKHLLINMKEEMDGLLQQLECSSKSEELLMLKLQAALDDVTTFRKDVVKFNGKCDDLTMEKYILEAKLQDAGDEISILAQKLAEFERLITELKVYESSYNECNEEKLNLQNLLNEESLQKTCLQSELKSVIDNYNILKVELDKKSSARDDLERTVDLLGEKLRCIYSNIESYSKQVHVPGFASISPEQKLEKKDYMAVMSHLEQLQLAAYNKVLELSQDKKVIEEGKDALQIRLKDKESQILSIKQKSESELVNILTKLGLSNSNVEMLKSELQDVERKLEARAESEQMLVENNRELTSKLTVLEYKLQDAANENKDFAQRLLEFDRICEELERARLDVVNCRGEKETLMSSLQTLNEANRQLEKELNKMKEQLLCSNVQLQTERGSKEKLEETVTNLTLQLNEKNEQIVSLDEQNSELVHLRLQVSNLESEKSALQYQLLHHEGHQRNLDVEMSSLHDKVAHLENELDSLKKALKFKDDEVHAERCCREEMEGKVTDLTLQLNEKETLMFSLQSVHEANFQLEKELNKIKEQLFHSNVQLQTERCSKEKLERTVTNLTLQLNEKNEEIMSLDGQKSEVDHLRLQIFDFESEKSGLQHLLLHHEEHQRNLHVEMSSLHDRVADLENELNSQKEALKSKQDDLHTERNFRKEMEDKVTDLTLQLNEKNDQLLYLDEQKSELACLSQKVLDLQSEKSTLEQLLLDNEKCRKEVDAQVSILKTEITSLDFELNKSKENLGFTCNQLYSEREIREKLEAEVSYFTSLLNERQDQLLHFVEQKVELSNIKQQVLDLESEKSVVANLLLSSKPRISELDTQMSVLSSQITSLHSDISTSRENLRSTDRELQSERDLRVKLEATVSNLTSVLNEKQKQLASFDEEKAELILLKQHVSDLESEKSELQQLLFQRDELHCNTCGETSFLLAQVTELETQLEELHHLLISADIAATVVRSRYQTDMKEFFDKYKNLEEQHDKLFRNHLDVVADLQNCIVCKEQCVRENETLSTTLQLLKSDSGLPHKRIGVHQMDSRTIVTSEQKVNFRINASEMGDNGVQQKHHIQKEIQQIKLPLGFEEEMENLRFSKDEHEITGIILRSKLYEHQEQITSLQECRTELINLQDQHNELTHRLCEQILKTEEFKNLSIHLKELKDKADAECHQIRDKRETEGPSFTTQESLRVAFIKEQYETKLQELLSQLHISRKHGEEILLKLQNALDEVEIRKNSEASHAKRNEELSIKVVELEAKLQRVVMDRHDLLKVHDKIQAELECSIINLDCCKEEKVKLEASLKECNEDRKKVRVELDLTKRRLESLTSISESQVSHEPEISKSTSFGQLLEEQNSESVKHQIRSMECNSPRKDAAIADRGGMQISFGGYVHLDSQVNVQSPE
ncbi:hypothetical protein Taro_004065, partial [Colocasia esculenta]|nr:hypothetical protein [Colocasia esculenta]